MSAVTLTIAIGSLICVGIALIVFVQAREKARLEKLQRISNLTDRYQNVQLILSDMPPQYIDNALRVMLLERSIQCIQELDTLKPSPKHAGYISEDEASIAEIRKNNPKLSPVRIDSTEQARDIRVLLQNLYKLLHLWRKRGQISPEQAQKYMGHVAFLARQSKADLFANKAAQAARAGKPRVAIHNYHSAIELLSEVATHPAAEASITAYRSKMSELKKIADQNTEKLKAKAQEAIKNDDQWNDYLTPEDDWKKKNSYDD